MQSSKQDNFDPVGIYDDSPETFCDVNTYLSSLTQAIYKVIFRRLLEHLRVLLVDGCRRGRSAAKSCARRGQRKHDEESGKRCGAAHWHIVGEIGQNVVATTILIRLRRRSERGSFVLQRRCRPSW